MADVVVAGHICLDLIPKILTSAEITPGVLREVGPVEIATGGCVANVGRALHRLGASVEMVARAGDDPFGHILRGIVDKDLGKLQAGVRLVPGGATSYSIVLSPPGIDRTFLHMPGENDHFTSADLPDDLRAKIFHFGYPPLMASMFADDGAELANVLAKAKSSGALVTLDLSLPDAQSPSGRANWLKILQRALPYVDLFLPSDAELAFMLGMPNPHHLVAASMSMGCKAVVLKCGDAGLLAQASSESIFGECQAEQPAYIVQNAETTGAGDATIAGILRAILDGRSLQECLRLGCAVGTHSVRAPDAVSGIPIWEEIVNFASV